MSKKTDTKLQLPAFLKVLSNAEMPMSRAMAFAAKVYKTHNTPSELGKLTDEQLQTMGVESKEDRKMALAAFKKAGYKPAVRDPVGANAVAGPSKLSSKTSPAKKRKRSDNTVNELLPPGPPVPGNYGFNEVLDEEVLKTKAAVVNRAPVMTAWATVVAERLGFKREEALSTASAYTEMNAISKGVAIGLFSQSEAKGIELAKGESQPYVDLMGRRIPVYTAQSGDYRALVKGEPVDPSIPYTYITRSFRQTLPFVIGSMRLLAETYEPAELNAQAYGLYMDFRPDVESGKRGWGERAEVLCKDILKFRKVKPKVDAEAISGGNSVETAGVTKSEDSDNLKEPPGKKAKSMSVEDYEAALDASTNYDDLRFDDDF